MGLVKVHTLLTKSTEIHTLQDCNSLWPFILFPPFGMCILLPMNSSGLCAFFTVALPACLIRYIRCHGQGKIAKPVEVERSSEPESQLSLMKRLISMKTMILRR